MSVVVETLLTPTQSQVVNVNGTEIPGKAAVVVVFLLLNGRKGIAEAYKNCSSSTNWYCFSKLCTK